MPNFVKVIKEIERNLNFILIFNVLLNSSIIYLVSGILLSFINVNLLWGLVPSLFYFLVSSFRFYSKDKIAIVENVFPNLDEKLKTARDHVYKDNEMIKELKTEVAKDLKKIPLSAFFHAKKTSIKLLVIIFLCFSLVFLSTLNIKGITLDDITGRSYIIVREAGNFISGNKSGSGDIIVDESIYGDDTIGELGSEEVSIEIASSSMDVDFRNIQDIRKEDFDEEIPSEIITESSETYKDNIPVDDQELVKNYFKNEVSG